MFKRFVAGGGVTLLALSFPLMSPALNTTALAYDGEQGCQPGDTDGGSDHEGGDHVKFHAHFHKNSSNEDCKDHPDADDQTEFSQESGPSALKSGGAPVALITGRAVAASGCQATFSPKSAKTDAGGNVSSTITLPPKCPGRYVFAARTASGLKAVVTVREAGGFPDTGGDARAPTSQGLPSAPAFGMVLAGSALLGAGLVVYRRRK